MASRFALLRPGGWTELKALDSEIARILLIPAFLTAVMLVIGFAVARMAGIDWSALSATYLRYVLLLTCLSALVYVFVSFAKLARALADDPVRLVFEDLQKKAPMLLLPALIFPLFLVGYTTAKTGIHFLVGFRWDAFWADADKLIFGDNAWRIAHRLLGTKSVAFWDAMYSTGWALCLLLYKANIALYASPRRVGTIYTAMLLTWIVGGCFFAYAFSAAGPVFAHLADPALTSRFHPLVATLDASLGPHSAIRMSQEYLARTIDLRRAIEGGGISAMPSMHVAAVTIYVLSALGTRWIAPAVAFWIVIFIGSGYFGYHYWIDGLFGALIAYGCWVCAGHCFAERPRGLPSATNSAGTQTA